MPRKKKPTTDQMAAALAELAVSMRELAALIEPVLAHSPALRRLYELSPPLAHDALTMACGAQLGRREDVEAALDQLASETETEAQSLTVQAVREILRADAAPPVLH